jgi:exonuclease SbcD
LTRPAPGTSDHAISLDFVRHVRGSDATPGEAALLREAIDACCHDPDQDVLVGAGPPPASGSS